MVPEVEDPKATQLVKARGLEQLSYRRVANPRMVPRAVVRAAFEEQEAILGKDPWSCGLTPPNPKNLETVQRDAHQQGLIRRIVPRDGLFADGDLGDAAGNEEI